MAEKPGKREKIRYGQAPRATLPTAAKNSETVNAGAVPEETASNADVPANPLEPTRATTKSRFSERAKTEKKVRGARPAAANANGAPPPDSGEVADTGTQSSPLGLNGDTATKKKKATPAATGDKKRKSQEKKSEEKKQPVPMTPAAPVPGAPAPADHPIAPATTPQ